MCELFIRTDINPWNAIDTLDNQNGQQLVAFIDQSYGVGMMSFRIPKTGNKKCVSIVRMNNIPKDHLEDRFIYSPINLVNY